MSLATFPHPNERHATPPPTKTAFPSTWECCFGRKSPEKQRVGSMVSFPNHPYRPSEWATNFENNPYRPSERASNFENNPYRPSEWATNFENVPYRPSEWATNFESNPYRPSEWATNFENVPYRPSEWAAFSENTLADGSEAGFSRKPFRLFGSASSPHGMQQKAGRRETRSTTACLYIDDPSAFNLTISHSRSPADGADWRSWDTCAHSS